MRYLILSDIHANLEGLAAVLKETQDDYDTICCLGDIVGYGADPNEVVDWARDSCSQVIRGNHDKACCGVEEPLLFNPVARAAVEWTNSELTTENLEYLRDLPKGPLELDDFVMVHGSYLDEDEYLVDIEDAAPQFQHILGRLVFFGHTHIQGGFFLRTVNGAPPVVDDEGRPSSIHVRDGDTLLVNPGSVGQPRDFLWEAAYAIFDSDKKLIEYRRCRYDVEAAQGKIRQAGLPEALAERLALGR